MASPTAQKTPPQLSPRSSPGPPTPGPSKLRKPRASLAIELSSGSDDDDERAARLAANEKARAAERFKDRNRVKAAIPDVDPHVILEMFRNPEYHQDPDLIASAILESNYRLRDGGWKWGYDPEVGPSGDDLASGSGERDLQKKVRRAENDSDTDSDSADARRASSHKAEKAARKSAKQKRARQRSSDDEEQDDDEEVDQLASDNDGAGSGQDDAEEEEEEDLTREEVMEQEGYWLDPEERDPPEDSYRKAA